MLEILVALSALVAIDGDTIALDRERIRIANIDSPEIGHAQCDAEYRLAIVAKRRLQAVLKSGEVEISRGDPTNGRLKDRHGRTLATITVDGQDVGDILISEGLARQWEGRRASWCERANPRARGARGGS